MSPQPLPIPSHFQPEKVSEAWRVPYQERAAAARDWAQQHNLHPVAEDQFKLGLILVDVQNTFCLPNFELYVAGRSGTGAVDDNRRLCQFIYRNLGIITEITPTLDTHLALQIFHPLFLVDDSGRNPAPYTLVTVEDIQRAAWKFNPAIAPVLGITPQQGQAHLEHYVAQLAASGKYDLTIWPYHAMLGGIGHALVSAVEEAIFFHSVARLSQPDFEVKGQQPLTEHYSVLGPEVLAGPTGEPLGQHNQKFIHKLQTFDAIAIAGQAKSHCVASTISDLLDDVQLTDQTLAKKVYLLEDCTSPVVIPGVIDYTDQADAAFQRFADAGMHIVKSTDPVHTWPGAHR